MKQKNKEVYFTVLLHHSFGVEHNPEEIKRFINKNNVIQISSESKAMTQ